MIPVVLLGIMVALTLIFLPYLNDDSPSRRPDEPQEETKERTAHAKSHLPRSSSGSEQ
jgi:hypothetical protein